MDDATLGVVKALIDASRDQVLAEIKAVGATIGAVIERVDGVNRQNDSRFLAAHERLASLEAYELRHRGDHKELSELVSRALSKSGAWPLLREIAVATAAIVALVMANRGP